MSQWAVFHGDALELLRTVPNESIDSIVTDPPYGLGNREPTVDELIEFLRGESHLDTGGDFMGQQWKVPSVEVWKECLRVLRPGGHLLSFGGTRTFDLISLGLRAAGFEYRDTVQWLYGSGFPKSLDVGKAIASRRGVTKSFNVGATKVLGHRKPITASATEEAAQWSGWGTTLKPSWEPVLLFRKPLAGTVASNVLAHGAGAINIDSCRVGWSNEMDRLSALPSSMPNANNSIGTFKTRDRSAENPQDHQNPGGRWPPNAVFTHSAGCRVVGARDIQANGSIGAQTAAAADKKTVTAFGDFGARGAWTPHGNGDGTETVPVYDCAPDCPVRVLEGQSGVTTSGAMKREVGGYDGASAVPFIRGRSGPSNQHGDTGTAARFFPRFEWSGEHDDPFLYSGKARTKEREAGCENIPPAESGRHNDHTTVKPVAFMRWLVRLVTPPGGVCLDPFAGSGTTGVACVLEGFHSMGFEAELRFAEISRARIGYWCPP